MHMSGPMKALAAMAISGCLLLAGAVPASAAQPRPARQASWRVAFKITGSALPGFWAVTAVSGTSAWAFEQQGNAAPVGYLLRGSTWTRHAIPMPTTDGVMAASSSSARDVWVFTLQGRAIHYNGRRWTVAIRFHRPIGSGLAITARDVWIFGSQYLPALGTWHFNGAQWTRISSGRGLFGASALSPTSIWAYGGTDVAHWNGRTWTRTSVKSLLPKNTALSHSFLAGIDAISAGNVYAVGSGGRQDQGGPLVVLHYNGHAWSRVATGPGRLGGPVTVIGDGHGGLWIPVMTGYPGSGTMDHYSHGRLRGVPLPYRPDHLALLGAAIGRRGTVAFAVGFYRKSSSSTSSTALILRYGP